MLFRSLPQPRVRVFKGKGQGQLEDTPGLPLPITILNLPRSTTGAIKSVQLEHISALIWDRFVSMLDTTTPKAAGIVAPHAAVVVPISFQICGLIM